jgi:hypothetical protein
VSRVDWFSFMDFPMSFKIPNETMTCIRWIFLQGVRRAQRNRIGEQIGLLFGCVQCTYKDAQELYSHSCPVKLVCSKPLPKWAVGSEN